MKYIFISEPFLDVPFFQKQWHDWLTFFVFISIAGFMVHWFSKEFIEVKFISKQSFLLYFSGMLGVVTTFMIAILIEEVIRVMKLTLLSY